MSPRFLFKLPKESNYVRLNFLNLITLLHLSGRFQSTWNGISRLGNRHNCDGLKANDVRRPFKRVQQSQDV